MLKLSKINSYYGQIHVLWDVSIEVKKNTITGLIGPNGAGKSTLLKTILGMVQPTSGTIEFNGKRIERRQTRDIVKEGIVYVPEGRRIFPEMTVHENLELGALSPRARDEKQKNLKEVYELFPILKERRNQLGGTFSGGELQLLAVARGLMGSPQLLMIDEPSLGLSPIAMSSVFRTIKKLNEIGKTVLIVEQNVPRLLNLASYAYLMENGKIASLGTTEELQKDQYVVKSYMGL